MNIKVFKFGTIVLLSLLVYACSEDQSNTNTDNTQPQPAENISSTKQTSSQQPTTEQFIPNYISADELNVLFSSMQVPYIFDVRSKPAFEKSHIETSHSMPYGKTDDQMLANTSGLSLNSEIITYCGCPRHLSSLSAKDLTDRGYTNVKVLYEGFWHWKDNGYPTVVSDATAQLTQLQFAGSVASSNLPVGGIDIFLKHPSGQLEAAKTDLKGEFKIEFNLYDYKDADLFEIIVADINEQPIEFTDGSIGMVNQLTIEL
jgi:rhodanese-related sulfurtransferase